MSKHTPGPWSIGPMPKMGLDIPIWKTLKSGNPLYICTAYNDGPLAMSSTEREANARLIAKAPELLDCLRVFAEAVKIGMAGHITVDPRDLTEDAILRARALIAEIEGGQDAAN